MFKRIKLVLVLLFIISAGISIANAQLPEIIDVNKSHFEFKPTCSHSRNSKHLADEMLAKDVYFRPYDVQHYDIFLDWYGTLNKPMKLDEKGFGKLEEDDIKWTGTNKITLKIDTSELSKLSFDVGDLSIIAVKVNNKIITPLPPVVNKVLTVSLDKAYHQNDIVTVEINYAHNKWYGKDRFKGYYLYPKHKYIGKIPVKPNDTAFVEERIAYTMSEPQFARYWLPCNDAPHDKATVTMKVRVPANYSVASNGLLQKVSVNDTAWTYYWKSDNVMPTYLIHAAASIYKQWSEWYHRVTNPDDSIEVKYFVWQKDYDATKKDKSQYNAKWAFEQNIEQIETFSRLYGEFPFKKYGLVSLQPFHYGGMEHQTITSINRAWMRNNSRWGLAHELAHQWLGDLVTCKTWRDIWVNEGGATFSEAIWSEHIGGKEAYLNNMLSKRFWYLKRGGSKKPPIYDLPINTIFGSNAVLVYQKASWIYHQLRMFLGDDVFFPALRSLFQKNKFTSIDHNDFIKSFSEDVTDSPIDFNTYFNQWLMKKGHPIFSMNVSTHFNGHNHYLADVTIKQTQKADNISDIFIVPIRIIFNGKKDEVFTDTLWQRTRSVTKKFDVPFFPSEIIIDTAYTLCEVDTIVTDVLESTGDIYSELLVSPNPLSRGAIGNLSFGFKKQGQVSITLNNLLGHKEKIIFNGYLDRGNYRFSFNTNNLLSGVYIVRVTSGTINTWEKIIIH